jgi:hypothetical protein
VVERFNGVDMEWFAVGVGDGNCGQSLQPISTVSRSYAGELQGWL